MGAENNEEQEEPKPKIVLDLEAIDNKYLEIEREYEKKVQELQKKYTALLQPFLDERLKLLCDTAGGDAKAAETGTPACQGFWLQAIKNSTALEEMIEEWDEPVLEYLRDVTKSYVDDDLAKGFRLSFHFIENPFFTNDVLWKEYHTEESSPYRGDIEAKEVKASDIDWKPDKNVTVEKIAKKTKGGGAKKAKQKKEKEEPRDSFFRSFFRNLKPDMPLPEDMNLEEAAQLAPNEEKIMELVMENDYEIGTQLRDQLVPFAVRFYTGEACPDRPDGDDDTDDEEDDEDDEDDDDDDEDESEDEPAPKKKAQAKKKGGGAGAGGKAAEDCKQQ